MTPRLTPPSPVVAIEFEEAGQDYGTWFVRNGMVIDCDPCGIRPFLGVKVTRPAVEGEKLHVLYPNKRGYGETPERVVKVTVLSAAQAADVVERWRQVMREIINE